MFRACEFYPSISEKLLSKALDFASKYRPISRHERNIILHAKPSLLFSNDSTWEKKSSNDLMILRMMSFQLSQYKLKGKFLLYISDKGNPLFDHGNYTQNLFPLYQHMVRHQSAQNKIPSKMDEKQTCLVSKFTSTFLCQDKDGQSGTLELCV